MTCTIYILAPNLETTIEKYAHLMRDELLENEVLELKEYAKLSDQCAKIALKDIELITKETR